MDLELSADLKTAISAWLARAVQHLNNHSQQLAELKKCMEGDDDVCIVYSVRRNALVIETMDRRTPKFFARSWSHWLGGLALPETM
jgi:hypothetical protein